MTDKSNLEYDRNKEGFVKAPVIERFLILCCLALFFSQIKNH